MSSRSNRNSFPARFAIGAALLAALFGGLAWLRPEEGLPPGSARPALLEPAAHEGATALAFPRESELLSVDPGGVLKRWDLASGRVRTTSLVGRGLYRKDTLRLRVDPSGSVCVSELGGGETCYALPLTGPRSAVRLGRLTWARPTLDGRYLYGAEAAGRLLHLFRPGSPRPAHSLRSGPGWSFSDRTALSPAGRFAAVAIPRSGGWELLATNLLSGRWKSVGRSTPPLDLQFSPDGRWLGWLTASERGPVLHVLRTGSWRPRSLEAGRGGSLLRFSPDGRKIATVTEAERDYRLAVPLPERRRERVFVIRVQDLEGSPSGAPSRRIRGHGAPVTDCVWSPGGRRVATLDEDGRIALWDVRSGILERFLDPHG